MPDTAVGPSPRGRRATIADVAARAGVSQGAVSFALNGRPGVADGTRQRILDAARELGWSPSVRARSLSRSTSYSVGLVVARTTELVGADPFFPAFVAGASAELAAHDRSLLFTVVPHIDEELATYRRLAAESRVDGVLVTDLRLRDRRLPALAELGLPAVTLGRPHRDVAGIGSVAVDDAAGAREVVETLLAQGHRHIAHVTGPDAYLHVRHRRAAWSTALADAGVDPGPLVHTDFSAGQGAAATERLLDAPAPPTAIVYANDVMAIAGLAVARRRGIDVPGRLSITGFDDTELANHVDPPLTSVRTDVEGWGRAAARALLAAVDGGAAEHLELEPARVVHRASVAPPPAPGRRTPGKGSHR